MCARPGGLYRYLLLAACAAATLLASGCASAPRGRPSALFSFEVGGPASSSGPSWVLDELPDEGSIELEGSISAAATAGAAALRIGFRDLIRGAPLAQIRVEDRPGEGAYGFVLEHRAGETETLTDPFEHALPWTVPLVMRIEWWPDRRLIVDIKGAGRVEQTLEQPFRQLSFAARAGTLHVTRLDYRNRTLR